MSIAKWYEKVSKTALIVSALYILYNFFQTGRNYVDQFSVMKTYSYEQQMLENSINNNHGFGEKMCENKTDNEQGLNESKAIDDLFKEGMSKSDMEEYDRNIKMGSKNRERVMDGASLLLAAKDTKFRIDPPRKEPETPETSPKGVEKYLNPNKNEEKGHKFEYRQDNPNKTLAFNRDTSFIKPRGLLEYGDKSREKKPDTPFEIAKDTKAIILVDISGSMCSNHNNFKNFTFNNSTYQLYLPSIQALTIADYYINEINSDVAAVTFSSNSFTTGFTKNMAEIADLYSRLQCSNTYIGYTMLGELVANTTSYLDIYILSDEDIFSIPNMKYNIQELEQVIGKNNELQRVFFIEWRTEKEGYNLKKEDVIKDAGMKNVYYSKITKLEDIVAWNKSLSDLLKKEKTK